MVSVSLLASFVNNLFLRSFEVTLLQLAYGLLDEPKEKAELREASKANYPVSEDVRSCIATIHGTKRQQGIKYTRQYVQT